MRLGITARLFVAILFTSIAVATAFGVAVHWNVDRGFREYVRDREARRLQDVANLLGQEYARAGNWSFLGGDEDILGRLAMRTRPPRPGGPDDIVQTPDPGMSRERRPLAPDEPEKRAVRGPMPPGPPARLSLTDADHRPLVGAPPSSRELLREPVRAGDAVVGWLISEAPAFAGEDQRFLRDQLRAAWVMGAFAVLAAALAALLLARGLNAPIRRLAHATHRLAAGDYGQRVEWASRDELGSLVRDFNTLAARLSEADQSRRDFLADVSHELRTPLAVLKGELEALQDGVRAPSPEAIRSLQAEVAMLGALVADLGDLAVADLGGHSYRRERLDLVELVRTALQAFAARLAAANLRLEHEASADAPVVGDPQRLLQVMNNLLENTVRYTDPGGRVRVSVRRVGGEVVLGLEDSAPGVPETLLPRLFDRLFRVDASRSRERGGSGIGLALCRGIVAAHGGTIAASASALGGVRIEVRLPAAAAGDA